MRGPGRNADVVRVKRSVERLHKRFDALLSVIDPGKKSRQSVGGRQSGYSSAGVANRNKVSIVDSSAQDSAAIKLNGNVESLLNTLVTNGKEQSRRLEEFQARLNAEKTYREEATSKIIEALSRLETQTNLVGRETAKHKESIATIAEPALILPHTGAGVPPRWGCCTSVSTARQDPDKMF